MNKTDRHPPAAHSADLSGTVCPMTFMQARLQLAKVEWGQVVELVLEAGEQIQSVPKDLKQEGHRIEHVRRDGDLFHLFVRRGEAED